MLNWIIKRRIRSFGRQYDYDVSYMNEILDRDRGVFMRFARVAELAERRGSVPVAGWFAAKLAATLAEDCGPCTQLVTKMAVEAGVPAAIVRAIIEGNEAAMDMEARLGWRFARAALAHDPEADRWREEIVARWGKAAVVSLALGIAASRMFPTVKYAMGYGHACQRIRVDGVDVAPSSQSQREAVPA